MWCTNFVPSLEHKDRPSIPKCGKWLPKFVHMSEEEKEEEEEEGRGRGRGRGRGGGRGERGGREGAGGGKKEGRL